MPTSFGFLRNKQPITVIGWGLRTRPTINGVPVPGSPQSNWPDDDIHPSVLQKGVDGQVINHELRRHVRCIFLCFFLTKGL